MKKYCVLAVILSIFFLLNCEKNYQRESIPSSNKTLFERSGIFDLKSPCLNFFSKSGERIQPICKMFFAESGEANAPSIEVDLKVCSEQINTNCIEPLPDNAPPEVIEIRDKNSGLIEPWSKVTVKLQVTKFENKDDKIYEVLEINKE